jgi:catechol 2,3-dioxygenase-like lactoylglutathione lyase family enzyme
LLRGGKIREPATLDHIGLAVGDFDRARAFYRAALKPLGLGVVMEVTAEETGGDAHTGFGDEGKPFFWIGTGAEPKGGAHVAFAARTRAEVDAFYAAAIAAGGRDNGAPGLRPHYHPNYYGAFVYDPDGNNIEAVCHRPEGR